MASGAICSAMVRSPIVVIVAQWSKTLQQIREHSDHLRTTVQADNRKQYGLILRLKTLVTWILLWVMECGRKPFRIDVSRHTSVVGCYKPHLTEVSDLFRIPFRG